MTQDTQDFEQYRSGFEAWAQREGWVGARENGRYISPTLQKAWLLFVEQIGKREASTEPSAEIDERHEFERVMSQRGDAANYIGDGMYSTGAVQDQWEIWLARAELAGGSQKDEAK